MKKTLFLLLGHVFGLSLAIQAQSLPYKVGVGVENITPCTPTLRANNQCKSTFIPISTNPDISGMLAGPAKYIESELETRVIVLQDQQMQRMALITLDVASLTPAFTADIQNQIVSLGLGIAANNVVINVSHTHSAPAIRDFPASTIGGATTADPEYVLGVKSRIMAAVQSAVANLQDASLSIQTGTSDIAVYRRHDEKYVNNVPVRVPQRLDVLTAKDNTGKAIAVAYFMACHPTTMYSAIGLVSADYPAVSRTDVEAALAAASPNAKALFFQGFGGDKESFDHAGLYYPVPDSVVNAGDPNHMNPASIAAKNVTGHRLGTAVTSTLQNAPVKLLAGNFTVGNIPYNLPLAGGTTYPMAIKDLGIGNSDNAFPWRLLFFSNEMVSEHEANVRSTFAVPDNVTLAGYSNFVMGYVPTQRMMIRDQVNCKVPPGGYEGCYAFTANGLNQGIWKDDDFFANQNPLFTDDFSATARDPERWIRESYLRLNGQRLSNFLPYGAGIKVPVRYDNGTLRIEPFGSEHEFYYNGLSTVHTYNFTNQQASIKLLQGPNMAEFIFAVARDGDNYYSFNVEGNQIRANQIIGGVQTFLRTATYSPTSHLYLRLRHNAANNVFLWETSSDGSTWLPFHSLVPPTQMKMTAMRIELVGGTAAAVSIPGEIVLDDFNIRGNDTPPLFTDNFDDNTTDLTKWYAGVAISNGYDANVATTEANGQLSITPIANGNGLHYNGYTSRTLYNFTGQFASIKVVQQPNVNSNITELILFVRRDDYNEYAFNLQGGQLRAYANVNGYANWYPVGSFNQAQYPYLRIRHDVASNTINWETSSTGTTWNVLKSIPSTMDLSAMRLEIAGGTWTTESASALSPIIVDNFNLPDNNTAARDGSVALKATGETEAGKKLLLHNYPNPFTGKTTISYALDHAEYVSLTVYDGQGRKVATLANEQQAAGTHQVQYDASKLGQGVYFYRLHTAKASVTKPMLRIN